MGRFLTPPGCPVDFHTDGSGLATLLRTIRYQDDAGRFWVARGFAEWPTGATIGDGASVPPILWPIFGHPWQSDHQRAGWLHDAGYQRASPCSLWSAMFGDERASVDAMFYQAICDDIADNRGKISSCQSIPKWRLLTRLIRWVLCSLAEGEDAYAMFLGVRLGGWWAWWKWGRANSKREVSGS